MKSLLRSLSILLVLCFSLGQTTLLSAQTLAGGGLKTNLDLPFDAGLFNDDTEDEDAPEIINFYSQQYEGDGIFYAIDRSGSMQNSGELDIAKREVSRNIREFSIRVQFGVVFFDRGIAKFPSGGRPTEANSAMKAAGLNWVQSIPGGSGSCVQQGLLEALKFANVSSANRKVVVYVGDGGGTCNGADEQTYLNQTLGIVKSQNYQRAQINAVGVLQIGNIQDNFLRSLATGNGGAFTKIQR